MIRTLTVVALAAAAVLPASAQQAAAPPQSGAVPTRAAAAMPATITSERLARFRQALLSQIAVHDAGEGAMRAPTAAEAAALAGPPAAASGRTEQVIALPSGGVALRADASSLSFLVGETRGDGKFSMRHDAPKAKTHTPQGGAHVR